MNTLLFEAAELSAAGELRLTGRRLAHLRGVLRAEPGARLRVGEIGGRLGEGRILSIDSGQARLAVTLQNDPPAQPALNMVLALPRPKMLRRILRSVAEFGVRELHLVNAARVEKSFWQSELLAPQALRAALLPGLEQSNDTRLPAVRLHRAFRPFAEDRLPALLGDAPGLLCHPGDAPLLPPGNAPATLLIGPEGGFVAFEVELLEALGCRPVTLGPRTLRVETAVVAALGRCLGEA